MRIPQVLRKRLLAAIRQLCKMDSKRTWGGAAAGLQRFRSSSRPPDKSSQPRVTGAQRGWFSLPHIHKSRLDFLKAGSQAFQTRLFALNVGSGPTAEMSDLCCVRSQLWNCRKRKSLDFADEWKERSFITGTANAISRFTKSWHETVFRFNWATRTLMAQVGTNREACEACKKPSRLV